MIPKYFPKFLLKSRKHEFHRRFHFIVYMAETPRQRDRRRVFHTPNGAQTKPIKSHLLKFKRGLQAIKYSHHPVQYRLHKLLIVVVFPVNKTTINITKFLFVFKLNFHTVICLTFKFHNFQVLYITFKCKNFQVCNFQVPKLSSTLNKIQK